MSQSRRTQTSPVSVILEQVEENSARAEEVVDAFENEAIAEELVSEGFAVDATNVENVKSSTDRVASLFTTPINITIIEQLIKYFPVPDSLKELYQSAVDSVERVKAQQSMQDAAITAQGANEIASAQVRLGTRSENILAAPSLLQSAATRVGRLFGNARYSSAGYHRYRYDGMARGKKGKEELGTAVRSTYQSRRSQRRLESESTAASLLECEQRYQQTLSRAQNAEALASNLQQSLVKSRAQKYVQTLGKDYVAIAQSAYNVALPGWFDLVKPVFIYLACLVVNKVAVDGAGAINQLAAKLDTFKIRGIKWIVYLLQKLAILWSKPYLQLFVVSFLITLFRKTVNVGGVIILALIALFPALEDDFEMILPFGLRGLPSGIATYAKQALAVI